MTYDPTTYASNVQRVTVPFTCVGKDTTEKESGIIVISLTDTGISITSRGIVFGSESSDVVAEMESIFQTATGKALYYVTFPALDAKYGKLFSSFSGMLSSTEVSKDWKFYVSTNVSGQLKLKDVAFVPRADLYGNVTISFVGYASSGESATCSLTFNVTEKTKSAFFSDVTASSYSWAADSVDFLHYEEVANGSNGKYNPKSNITRGDFMLMLYRAFLEAICFGALRIIDCCEAAGHPVRRIFAAGGIAAKNPLMMQLLADICGRPVQVCASAQTCALGSAILGAAAARPGDFSALIGRMASPVVHVYSPRPEEVTAYRRLYEQYLALSDFFSRPNSPTGRVCAGEK